MARKLQCDCRRSCTRTMQRFQVRSPWLNLGARPSRSLSGDVIAGRERTRSRTRGIVSAVALAGLAPSTALSAAEGVERKLILCLPALPVRMRRRPSITWRTACAAAGRRSARAPCRTAPGAIASTTAGLRACPCATKVDPRRRARAGDDGGSDPRLGPGRMPAARGALRLRAAGRSRAACADRRAVSGVHPRRGGRPRLPERRDGPHAPRSGPSSIAIFGTAATRPAMSSRRPADLSSASHGADGIRLDAGDPHDEREGLPVRGGARRRSQARQMTRENGSDTSPRNVPSACSPSQQRPMPGRTSLMT